MGWFAQIQGMVVYKCDIHHILHKLVTTSRAIPPPPWQALTHKHIKYDPLIQSIQNNGWKPNPLVTITARVRGAIHEHSIKQLIKLKISKPSIKTLMKNLH